MGQSPAWIKLNGPVTAGFCLGLSLPPRRAHVVERVLALAIAKESRRSGLALEALAAPAFTTAQGTHYRVHLWPV